MTAQDLKNSILQLAMQGKLVEQRAEEGTAEELYKQIQEEKQKLIKEGKIKKENPLPEIAEDEIPFEIPDSWKWVRFGNIIQMINGDRGKNYPSKDKLSEIGTIPFISAINMHNNTISKNGLLYVSKEQYDLLGSGKLKKGDLVLCIRGSLGKNAIYPYEKGAIASSLVIIRSYLLENILYSFISYYFDTPLFKGEINTYNNGTAQPNLSARDLSKFLFPLPPLEEQKRIVSKIEELLPYIEQYDKAHTKLETFNKKFPEDMKKSILQYAMQGKLVEQRAEEGTAEELYKQIQEEKQKLIKEGMIKKDKRIQDINVICEDEFFEIPYSWKWVSLGSVLNKLTDGTHKTPRYVEKGVKFVSVKNMSDGKLSLENTKFITKEEHQELYQRCNPQKGDILLSKVGTTGVPAIIDTDEQFSLFVSVALLKFNCNFIYDKFLYYLILSPLVQLQAKENTRGVGNKNWVLDAIANTKIVLPPLEEQKRIVAKIEELLLYCEKLKK